MPPTPPAPAAAHERVPPIVAGYVARALHPGQKMPFIAPPHPAGAALMRSLAPVLGRLRWRQPRARSGIEGSVLGLRKHCAGIEDLDEETLRLAREAVAPVPDMAAQLDPPFQPFGPEDATVLAAARWFKHTYFRWADPIKCQCGGGTQFGGMGQPSADDLAGGAGRVEIHRCTSCGAERRFPRYNEVKALMGSREGRCGEFAQLFYVFLLVLGVKARYVWNSEDHVWTEYWSPALGHWTHVDSCEAETSKPQLYDRGWGKEQRWCLAYGPQGAEDVTPAYVDDWDACLARRLQKTEEGGGIAEHRLRLLLLSATIECRGFIPLDQRAELDEMDASQARWIADERRRDEEAERAGLKGKGRESGTKEWVEERGEGGAEEK